MACQGPAPPRPSAVQAEADGTGELLVTRTQLEAETMAIYEESPFFDDGMVVFPWPGFKRHSGNS